MPIYQIEGHKLKKLNLIPVDKEKTLQNLIEENLDEMLDMVFLASEYTTTFGQRIDTLAVDANGAPVIIEYKRNQNDNVINQALSYLKWLKSQQPGFFEKLMQEKMGADACKIPAVDWRNPRVICVAESFSKFDRDTAEVVPLRIELMQYRYYENGIFSLEPVGTGQDARSAGVAISRASWACQIFCVNGVSVANGESIAELNGKTSQRRFPVADRHRPFLADVA